MPSKKVIIIGAGPAGLTAAYVLAKAGVSPLVLEADPQYVGGISRTVQYKGFRFDIGGHRFFSKSQEIEDLWTEILSEDLLVRPRSSRICYKQQFFSYPLKPAEAFLKLGPFESIRCGLSYLWARLFPIAAPRSFQEWVTNKFGRRLFEIFLRRIRRRYGVCPAPRSLRTGRLSGSRACRCGRPSSARCGRRARKPRTA